MAEIRYDEDHQSQDMTQPGVIRVLVLLFLFSEVEHKKGPHYEYGNMNCPCGGGFKAGTRWELQISLKIYVYHFTS